MVDAREFHKRTSHSPESIKERTYRPDPSNRPRPDKRYIDVERIRLDQIRPTQQPALAAIAQSHADVEPEGHHPEFTLTALATICYEANGIVQRVQHHGNEVLFRAASCTGKLYHIDLYLICGDLDGLDAGVYHFDPSTFSFDVLRRGDYRGVIADAVNGSGGGIESAPVSVVLTSTWWRNAWKYHNRAYRHAFWDGGTVIANLLASAHGQGHRAQVVAGFVDNQLTRLLGVRPEMEAPIAVVPIGQGMPSPSAPAVEPIDYDTAALSRESRTFSLIVDAWAQSRFEDPSNVRSWVEKADASATIGRVKDVGEGPVSLQPVDDELASKRPLFATIKRRGSKRSFEDDGPSKAQLSTVLDRALCGIPADWNGGGAAELTFNDPYLLVTDIEGMDDGRYRYDAASHTGEWFGTIDRATKAHLALDQSYGGEAHVNVYLLTGLGDVVETLGNRGYRAAQLEAGIALGRLYLASAAHRALGGTGLTFFDDLVTESLGPFATSQTPTCLYAFGKVAA